MKIFLKPQTVHPLQPADTRTTHETAAVPEIQTDADKCNPEREINMMYFLLLLLILLFYQCKCNRTDFYKDYLSKTNCNQYRGFFALMIVACHIANIFAANHLENPQLCKQLILSGNLSNAVFFFISGFGLVIQLKLRPNYLDGFLWKRLPKIALPFIAVLFLYYGICWHNIPFHKILNEFAHGGTLNSNSWFIFAILYFYLIFYLSYRWTHTYLGGLIPLTLGVCAYIYVLKNIWLFPSWWYSSCVNFLLGALWGIGGHRILPTVQRWYAAFFIGIWTLFYCVHNGIIPSIPGTLPWSGWISSSLFTMGIMLLGMKIQFTSNVWQFLGNCSYEIYMIHGMMLSLCVSRYTLARPWVYVYCVFAATIAAAFLLHTIFYQIQKFITPRVK